MKEQPKTTEEKKKIKQGFCSLRSPVYAQISERQDLSLCLSCFPFFLSASHKDKKLVFFVVFYLFIAAGCLTNHQGSMCRVMLSIHTDTYTHTLICKLLHTVWFHSKPEKNVAYICTTSGHLCKPPHYTMSHWTIPVGSCKVNNIWQHKQTKERIRKVFISSIVTPTHNILLLRSETCNVYSASGSRV